MYESLMERLLDEENNDIIELQTEGGQPAKYEQIAVVMCDGEPYAMLHPVAEGADKVVIFRMDTEDEDNLVLVTDKDLAHKILDIYEVDWKELAREEAAEEEGENNE